MTSVIAWTRLEPYTRSVTLESGLRAAVHDPLWMVARQWQLGELHGEDAGSPVQVRLRMDCTPLTRYLPAGVPSDWYAQRPSTVTPTAQGRRIDSSLPLEPIVEQERVHADNAPTPRLAAEAGLHFLRILAREGAGMLRNAVISLFPLEKALHTESVGDADTRRFLSIMGTRVPDGVVLASVLRVIDSPSELDLLQDPFKDRVARGVRTWQTWFGTLAADNQQPVRAAALAWIKWNDSLFIEPEAQPGDTSWIPERLEYEFAVSSPTPHQEVVLTSPEYTDGHLDWYSFDVATTGSLGASRADLSSSDVQREAVQRTVIPTPLEYPGMPASRYWEFEDARVDFGAVAAGAQQLAHLLLIEFALIGGDDWYIVPVDMPVGSVATVRWLVVTDTFGDRTLVRSARDVDRAVATNLDGVTRDSSNPTTLWDMFRLGPDRRPFFGAPSSSPDAFLLAPTLGTSLHGGALEDVRLLRDEMANMAWAVERTVENPLGRPFNRSEAVNQARAQTQGSKSDAVTPPLTPLKYRLVTDVPDHWVPLYPTRSQPVDVVGSRDKANFASMRLLRGGSPHGRILEPWRTPAANPLLIAEEEIPRAGARVTRAFQYSRTADGRTCLWIGRRKSTGRGEGSSGVRFDVLEARRP